jgi:hypothetical protein
MTQTINILTKKDIEKIVKDELEKKFYIFEKLLNTLKGRILDMENIMDYQSKRLKENKK